MWIWIDWVPGILGVGLRYCILKRLSKNCGKNVFIGRNVEIKGWSNLSIGNNVSIHKDCYIDATGEIVIENDVSIAHGCSILSFEHTWENSFVPIRDNPFKMSPVYIKCDVWIGCGSRILSGVTISSRTIIAAGCVVTKSTKDRTIVTGVPGRVIKRI